MIGKRLIERGARRLAFLTPTQAWPAMAGRQAGLEQVATAAGAELQVVTAASERLEDTQIAMGRHIDRMGLPDALSAATTRWRLLP